MVPLRLPCQNRSLASLSREAVSPRRLLLPPVSGGFREGGAPRRKAWYCRAVDDPREAARNRYGLHPSDRICLSFGDADCLLHDIGGSFYTNKTSRVEGSRVDGSEASSRSPREGSKYVLLSCGRARVFSCHHLWSFLTDSPLPLVISCVSSSSITLSSRLPQVR
jgi:hypothetical protein